MKWILNFIGSIIRDIVVCCSGDFIEYTIYNGKFLYKSPIPISFQIGNYIFMKEEDFLKHLIKNN